MPFFRKEKKDGPFVDSNGVPLEGHPDVLDPTTGRMPSAKKPRRFRKKEEKSKGGITTIVYSNEDQ